MSELIYVSLFLLFALIIAFISFAIGGILSIGDGDVLWAYAWFVMVIVAAIELVVILYLKGMIPT